MKKKKLPWSLKLENLLRKPKELLEDWLIQWVGYSIEEELSVNVFIMDESNEMLDYFSTASAGYQTGMIVQLENKERFLVERIEVSRKCNSWELYGKVIK